MEISPNITESVTKKFKATFEGKISLDKKGNQQLTDKQMAFKQLKKPEICDSLESTSKSIYKAPIILDKESVIQNKITELVGIRDKMKNKFTLIENFKNDFVDQFKREPTEEEIIENFINDNENDVDEELILEFFRRDMTKDEEQLDTDNILEDSQNIKVNIV